MTLPSIRLGTARVPIPQLHGPVGPERLRERMPGLNRPSDVALVDRYLAAVADLRRAHAASELPGSVTGAQVLPVADAVRNWKTDRAGAIAAFQRVEKVGGTTETADGIVMPGGPTWRALVTYGELSTRLEEGRDRKVDPRDYVHTGGFRTQTFVAEAIRRFRADKVVGPRFTAASVPAMLDLLTRISLDPRVIDVRWVAYMLATAMWETSRAVTTRDPPPSTRTHRRMQWGDPVEEGGRGRLNADDVKDYYLKVKVRRLPDGGAEVTEQDGDAFDVSPAGRIVTRPRPVVGSDPWAAPTQAYAKATGTELAFYGRGYVQLTWWNNYANDGAQIGLGLQLLFEPDKALDPDVAYRIMANGMINGVGFSNGRRLQFYLCGPLTDYVGARAMVNGHDRAQEIARGARIFEDSLMAAKA